MVFMSQSLIKKTVSIVAFVWMFVLLVIRVFPCLKVG